MRIIFVGMHNKPGKAPLCSSTRSGKLIDRVIQALQIEGDLFGSDFLKTNLFNLDHMPTHDSFNFEWCERVGYNSDLDLPVCLGVWVKERFLNTNIPFTSIGHPSAVWSYVKQEEYIKMAVDRILKAHRTLLRATARK